MVQWTSSKAQCEILDVIICTDTNFSSYIVFNMKISTSETVLTKN